MILVHCYYGVSRSATIVMAYLMKTHKINYDQCFERVKLKRRFIGPNTGFVTQLKLYHKMGFKIDCNYQKYKNYRLRLAADSFKKAKMLTHQFLDLIKQDPGLQQINPEPIVYRCRKCRRIVAAKSNVIVHKPVVDHHQETETDAPQPTTTTTLDGCYYNNDDHNYLTDKLRGISINSDNNSGRGSTDNNDENLCNKMYFVEPLAWMKEITNNSQGRLYCPKCSSKLGNFSWVMGCQCPCGVQVSPAFYLVPSKVEYSTIVQNIQRTV